jgi:hypothetical protein
MIINRSALALAVLLLALVWVSAALAGPAMHCTSTYSSTLQQWQTTITDQQLRDFDSVSGLT